MLTRNIHEAKYRTALKENRQETRKTFQVDNKLKHTARAKNKRNIYVLDWSSQSNTQTNIQIKKLSQHIN